MINIYKFSADKYCEEDIKNLTMAECDELVETDEENVSVEIFNRVEEIENSLNDSFYGFDVENTFFRIFDTNNK